MRLTATIGRYDYKYGQVSMSDGTVDETKNNGQIALIEGTIGTQRQWQQRFSYDSPGRLTSAGEYRGDTLQQSYLLNYEYLDPFGNRYQRKLTNPHDQKQDEASTSDTHMALIDTCILIFPIPFY